MALSEVDRELLDRCLAQQPGSWKNFVDRFMGLVIHVVHKVARNRSLRPSEADREDLVAEVFLTLVADDFAVLRRGFAAVEALVLRALLAGACLGAACFVTTPVSGAAFAEAAFAGSGLAAFFGAALTSVAKEGSGAACLRVVGAAFLRAVLGAAPAHASAHIAVPDSAIIPGGARNRFGATRESPDPVAIPKRNPIPAAVPEHTAVQEWRWAYPERVLHPGGSRRTERAAPPVRRQDVAVAPLPV